MLTERQISLLRAALLQEENGKRSWLMWVSGANLDTLEAGEFPLMPLVFYNQLEDDTNHQWKDRLKGIARHAWVSNQIMFRQSQEWEIAFQNAGIGFHWIGDAVLAGSIYPSNTIRPIFQRVGILQEEKLSSAQNILKARGICPLKRSLGQVLSGTRIFDAGVILRGWVYPARTYAVERPFSAAEQLLYASLRFSWEHPKPLVCLADIHFLLRSSPDCLSKTVELALALDLALPLQYSLASLKSAGLFQDNTIPNNVYATSAARREHAIRNKPPRSRKFAEKVWLAWKFIRK
jgi:hypothetical protein